MRGQIRANYSLADRQAYAAALGKKGAAKKQIGYKGTNVVTEYALEQNYPNPFNPVTTINYTVGTDVHPSNNK